jgi:hypothetical protein
VFDIDPDSHRLHKLSQNQKHSFIVLIQQIPRHFYSISVIIVPIPEKRFARNRQKALSKMRRQQGKALQRSQSVVSFTAPNRKKSHGARSVLWGGYSILVNPKFVKIFAPPQSCEGAQCRNVT